jgi:pectin methylesterase-like acyl-CoA thioesterase
VLGPPPIATGDVSAFAELFGAAATTSATPTHLAAVAVAPAAVAPVAVAPAHQHISIQEAVDALVVPRDVASPELPVMPPTVEVAQDPAPFIDQGIDDDLLPTRTGRGTKVQPTRAWSLGRSKR